MKKTHLLLFCYRKGKMWRNGRKRWKKPVQKIHKKWIVNTENKEKYRKIKKRKSGDVSQKYMVSDKEKDQ